MRFRLNFKIFISYLLLIALGGIAAYSIYSEVGIYLKEEPTDPNDLKLIKTSELIGLLYRSESLSKNLLQSNLKEDYQVFTQTMDSIYREVDSLHLLTTSNEEVQWLDSINILLGRRVSNINNLRLLQQQKGENSIDETLTELEKIGESMGRFNAETLFPNYANLDPKVQQTLREYAQLLSKNVPRNSGESTDPAYTDSILSLSKQLLRDAQQKEAAQKRSTARRETVLMQNNLEISDQIRSLLTALENEILINSYNQNVQKQASVRRSIRMAGLAAVLGFTVVLLFGFLINRDFWKIQRYRKQIEGEKNYSEFLLKSREQLIASVSHDLRSPLNTIQGYTELLEQSELSAKQNDYIRHVSSASGYLEDLINDLMDYNQLEKGKLKLENTSFVPYDLIAETAESIEAIYLKKGLVLETDLADDLKRTFIGDAFRLRQILSNLIGNAFKFTHKGTVKIIGKTKKETGEKYRLILVVEDTGIGISKEQQAHIYKEFTQGDENTQKRYGGYGLGLTISKKLVDLLGGTLSLKSKRNMGSRFEVNVPLTLTSRPLDAAIKKKPLPIKSILIIDDDPSLLQLLSAFCKQKDIRCHTFSSLNDVPNSESLKYDLVLTDIEMPDTTGFEVLEKFKGGIFKHYLGQPVFAMTGRKEYEAALFKEKGFQDVLIKPIGRDKLFEKLQLATIHKTPEKEMEEIQAEVYNIKGISEFLSQDQEAIREVLTTFYTETQANLNQLKQALLEEDTDSMSRIAHKMLPMFRQLKIKGSIPFLETLELGKDTGLKPRRYIEQSEQAILKIQDLVSRLESDLLIPSDYTD